MTRALLVLAMAASIPASATIFGFTCIPASGGGCAVNAAPQLTVDVTSSTIGATSAVSFVFRNIGNIDSVITNIYWDDRRSGNSSSNRYLNFATNAVGGGVSQGVNFRSTLASGGTLPRGSTLSVPFVSDASARPNSSGGVANNGVQDGSNIASADALQVRIALRNSVTLNDVLAGIGNGTLRIGFHLQGLRCAGISPCQTSDTYINNPGSPTPEPGSYAVLSLGLGLVAWAQRKRFVGSPSQPAA